MSHLWLYKVESFTQEEIFFPCSLPKRFFKFKWPLYHRQVSLCVRECHSWALRTLAGQDTCMFDNGFYNSNTLFYCGKRGALLMTTGAMIDFSLDASEFHFDDEKEEEKEPMPFSFDLLEKDPWQLSANDLLPRIAMITYDHDGPAIGIGWRIQDDMVLVSSHTSNLIHVSSWSVKARRPIYVQIYGESKSFPIQAHHPERHILWHAKSTISINALSVPTERGDRMNCDEFSVILKNGMIINEFFFFLIFSGQFCAIEDTLCCMTRHSSFTLDSIGCTAEEPHIQALQKWRRHNTISTRKDENYHIIAYRIEQLLRGPIGKNALDSLMPESYLFILFRDFGRYLFFVLGMMTGMGIVHVFR